jgi:NAD(P)-dependent dehydrogenase (short-subunit alcohol dehydrogenase family)
VHGILSHGNAHPTVAGASCHRNRLGLSVSYTRQPCAGGLEYSRQGIRINTLLFGVFATEKAQHAAMPSILEKNAAKHHVGRLGDPEQDMGEAVAWLKLARSSFVTCTTLQIDSSRCF